jgi:hypothetical protein
LLALPSLSLSDETWGIWERSGAHQKRRRDPARNLSGRRCSALRRRARPSSRCRFWWLMWGIRQKSEARRLGHVGAWANGIGAPTGLLHAAALGKGRCRSFPAGHDRSENRGRGGR